MERRPSYCANTPTATAYSTAGSYGTHLGGLLADTGAIAGLGGGRVRVNLEQLDSMGAGSGTSTERRNGFVKYEQPIGNSTVLTALVNLDNTKTRTPYGTTLANIQAFGPGYSLNNDPTSQSFSRYNHDSYHTDFEYVGIKSDLGNGLVIDDKVYTTSYDQNSSHGADVGGQAPNLAGTYLIRGVTPTDLSGDVPAFSSKYYFRNTGNVLRISQDRTASLPC